MRAEIIAVGTELLLGQTVNTNAAFLAEGLAELGIDVYFQTVVGDNVARIRTAIEISRSRADLLLFTGGLGPTQDDLTKDALAAYLGRSVIEHQPSFEKIKQQFASRGIHMVESNRRQANMIEGSEPLANDAGLAVGNALTCEGTHYILLPGPPREMKPMFNGVAKDWLRAVLGEQRRLFSRTLKFSGIGESTLEARLLELIEGQSDPTIAPYAKEGEVAIRIATKALSQDEATVRLDEMELRIDQLVGDYKYASDDLTLEEVVVRNLHARQSTLVAAESLTGGLFGTLITSVSGSSEVFAGSLVTYTAALKQQVLGIPSDVLEQEGAVSKSTAMLMAEAACRIANATYAVALTGVAGPSMSEGKPVGLVYVAIAEAGQQTEVHELNLIGNRTMIRTRAAKLALHHLLKRTISP